ncbi:MAG: hypothetical protein ABIL02_00540 [candidate division WOR-3 bacterium]
MVKTSNDKLVALIKALDIFTKENSRPSVERLAYILSNDHFVKNPLHFAVVDWNISKGKEGDWEESFYFFLNKNAFADFLLFFLMLQKDENFKGQPLLSQKLLREQKSQIFWQWVFTNKKPSKCIVKHAEIKTNIGNKVFIYRPNDTNKNILQQKRQMQKFNKYIDKIWEKRKNMEINNYKECGILSQAHFLSEKFENEEIKSFFESFKEKVDEAMEINREVIDKLKERYIDVEIIIRNLVWGSLICSEYTSYIFIPGRGFCPSAKEETSIAFHLGISKETRYNLYLLIILASLWARETLVFDWAKKNEQLNRFKYIYFEAVPYLELVHKIRNLPQNECNMTRLNNLLTEYEPEYFYRTDKVDLKSYIDIYLKELSYIKNNVKYSITTEGENFFVEANTKLLNRVLHLIFKENIQHIKPRNGGLINFELKLSSINDKVQLIVLDNGPGFPERYLNDLGKKVIEDENGNKHKGLLIASVFMERMGARITFANHEGRAMIVLDFNRAVQN